MDTFISSHPILASLASNLIWELVRMAVISVPVYILLRWAFGLLRTLSQSVVFWLTVPLTLSLAALFWVGPVRVTSTAPNLAGSLDQVRVFQANQCRTPMAYPNSDPDDVYILLAASVRNSGSPSIADSWSLTVNSPTKGLITPEALELPPNALFEFNDTSTNTNYSYSGKDALYEKTFTNPVPQGAVVRGLLLYRLKGYAVADLDLPNTEYKITFQDILGHISVVDWRWPPNNLPLGYLPGLLQPTIPTPIPSAAASPS